MLIFIQACFQLVAIVFIISFNHAPSKPNNKINRLTEIELCKSSCVYVKKKSYVMLQNLLRTIIKSMIFFFGILIHDIHTYGQISKVN